MSSTTIKISDVINSQGYAINTNGAQISSKSIVGVGDFNGDKFNDFGFIKLGTENQIIIVKGTNFTTNSNLVNMDSSKIITITKSSSTTNQLIGDVLFPGYDLNNDGFDDVITNVPSPVFNEFGSVNVIFGKQNIDNIQIKNNDCSRFLYLYNWECSGILKFTNRTIPIDYIAASEAADPQKNKYIFTPLTVARPVVTKDAQYGRNGAMTATQAGDNIASWDDLSCYDGIRSGSFLYFGPAYNIVPDFKMTSYFAVGDFDNNKYSDIAMIYSQDNFAMMFRGSAKSYFTRIVRNAEIALNKLQLGTEIKNLKDFNRDNYTDFIINSYDGANKQCIFSVVYGNPLISGNGNLIKTTQIMANVTSSATNCDAKIGNSGDVNGDGYSDAIITLNSNIYVIYGSANSTNFNIESMDASQGFAITGSGHRDFGKPAHIVKDLNGDKYDDVVFYDPGAIANGQNQKLIYVLYGNSSYYNTENNTYAVTSSVTESLSSSLSDSLSDSKSDQSSSVSKTISLDDLAQKSTTVTNSMNSASHTISNELEPIEFLTPSSTKTVSSSDSNTSAPQINSAIPSAIYTEVKTIANVMSQVSTGISVVSVNPSNAIQAGRFNAISQISNCKNNDNNDNEPLPRTESPTGLAVTNSNNQYLVGAVIGNIGVVLGSSAIYSVVSRITPIFKTMGDAGYPGGLLFVPIIFLETMAKHATSLFILGKSDVTSYAIGALGALFDVSCFTFALYKLTYGFQAKYVVDSTYPKGEWTSVGPNTNFHNEYKFLYEEYKPQNHKFLLADMSVNILMGSMSGIAGDLNNSCSITTYLATLVNIGFFAATIYYRPQVHALNTAFTITMSALQTGSLVIASYQQFTNNQDNEILNTIKETLGLVCQTLLSIKTLIDIKDVIFSFGSVIKSSSCCTHPKVELVDDISIPMLSIPNITPTGLTHNPLNAGDIV